MPAEQVETRKSSEDTAQANVDYNKTDDIIRPDRGDNGMKEVKVSGFPFLLIFSKTVCFQGYTTSSKQSISRKPQKLRYSPDNKQFKDWMRSEIQNHGYSKVSGK